MGFWPLIVGEVAGEPGALDPPLDRAVVLRHVQLHAVVVAATVEVSRIDSGKRGPSLDAEVRLARRLGGDVARASALATLQVSCITARSACSRKPPSISDEVVGHSNQSAEHLTA
jgi:hypothetical protein